MSIDVAELRRLAMAATKGPWYAKIGADQMCSIDTTVGHTVLSRCANIFVFADTPDHGDKQSDAELIAAMRNALLSLLDELEGLRNVLNEFVNLNVDIVCAKAADKRKIEALHDKAIAAIRAAEGKGDE